MNASQKQSENILKAKLAAARGTNTFRCRECGKGFDAVKYIEGKTKGVSPCCNGWFDYVKLSHRTPRAASKVEKLRGRLQSRGIDLPLGVVKMLRQAEQVLHRWSEWECGLSDAHKSYCIVRDEATGKPFVEFHPYTGPSYRHPCADREAAALRRVCVICEEYGLNWFYQTDPRGCALYISNEPLGDSNYSSRGIAVCD